MSIDRSAVQGAFGAADRSRKTKEGNREERSNLEAMAKWYDRNGDPERAAECRARVKELKKEVIYE